MDYVSKEVLAFYKIYNSWGIMKHAHTKLMIAYVPAENGLASRSAYWVVQGNNISTNKDGFWMDHGNKTFDVRGRDEKQKSLLEAQEWCKAKYGILGFEKDPFGGYQELGTARRLQTSREGIIKGIRSIEQTTKI